MHLEDAHRHLDTQVTRRRVVTTGVKLAYAAPLVAASFRLTAGGVLAVTCTAPAFELNNKCCTCPSCTTGAPGVYNPTTGQCEVDTGTLVLTCGTPICTVS